MNLLAGKLYDPGTAVSKATSALLALTALDTTNLRLSFVVPASGIVRVRLSGTLHGATTVPQIILGILEGSTVKGRGAPMLGGGNIAATTMVCAEVIFVVTGLTPAASLTWDAAYGVETVVAATGLKYGGPNNTTGNDNFGGFSFEIWDPCPIYTPTSGTPPTIPISTRIDTIDDFVDTEVSAIKTKTDFLPSATAGSAGGLFIAGSNAATSITTALTANITGNVTGNLSGSVGSVTSAIVLPTIPNNWITAAGINAAAFNGKGDWNIGKTGYSLTTAPLDAAGTRTALGLALANLDTQLAALFPTVSYVAPDNVSITAIKAKTDSLTYTLAGQVDANIQSVNDTVVTGNGSPGTEWGPI